MKLAPLSLLVLLLAGPTPPVVAQDRSTEAAGVERADRGDDFYCAERRLGQWFYCTRPKAEPKPETAAPESSVPEPSATERMAAIKQELDELKAKAILDPSEANVVAYVRFQREQLDRASTFSDTWQRALWQNPDIDYTLQRPVNTVAKRAWLDIRKVDRDQVLTNLGKRYGLFYFFAQSCAACEVFSPILRSVADSHRMAVMAVSMDGGPNRDFPRYVVDSGQRARMGLQGNETPALVLFDTATKRTIPVGYGTRTAETVFVMPSELNYSTNGMVYGARLFDATRNFVIRDAEFATNLERHFKNCVFGDVMLYRKSLTDLAKAPDLWAAIGPGSEARSQEWLERQGDGTVTSNIVTCRQAYGALNAQWATMIEANTPLWAKEVYPKLSNDVAAAKLRHDVPIINAAFTSSGSDYTGVMRQNTAINAFMQARNSMAGGTGAAAIDTFAQTRADIQARNTYNSIAQQAMAWVPILNIVLTVVFFAMFPVIFPLFLMPQTGLGTLKGYAIGFFYLAAWGPLYVILHMICMTRAEAAAAGVAGGGVTLGSYAGIGAVNGETATIAGFMLMSIPFLAAGLAKGAMSIAGQATSMLAPAQNAAEAAALEQTTGNYSYGNVSWANATSNMRQANQWTTAAAYMGGAASVGWRQDNGATITGYGDGQEVFDTGGAISRLSFTPTMSTGAVAEWRQMASEAHRQSQAYENAAQEMLTWTKTDRSAYGTSSERSAGWDTSTGRSANTSIEQFDRSSGSSSQGLEDRSSTGQSLRVSSGTSRDALTTDQVSGQLSAGIGGAGGAKGGGGRLASILPGGGIGISKSGTQQRLLRHGTDDARSSDSSSTATTGVRDEHSNGSGASTSEGTYDRAGSFSRASSASSSSLSHEQALARAKSFTETARKLEELSQQLTRDASFAETHGMQLSENMSQELTQWYRGQQVSNPGLDAPELWATNLTDQQRAVRQEMISRWMRDKELGLREEIGSALREPALVSVARPATTDAADVRASYHPQDTAAVPHSPSVGDPDRAAALIEAGRTRLDSDRLAAEGSRSTHVGASVDIQGEVHRAQDRGFFLDPKLRE